MSSTGYVILAYVVGLGLLWGYAASLWLGLRRASRYNGSATSREP